MADKPTSGVGARATPARKPARSVWQRLFIEELANTSNVSAAARTAGVHTYLAYAARRSDEEFNRKWQLALCEGYDNLEMDLLHRLRSGELKPAAGAKRGVRCHDNATALRLLAAHRESAARTRAVRDNVSAASIRASIDRKVAEIRARVLATAALEQAGSDTPDESHE